MLVGPFAADARAKLGPLGPQLLGDGAEIDLKDPHALGGGNHHDVAVVRVLELDQLIDIRRRVDGEPTDHRHLKLEAQKEGLRTGLYARISDDPLRPTFAERTENPRARSAKLRWAVRTPSVLER